MMCNKKRFKITKSSDILFRSHELQEVVKWLQDNPDEVSLNTLYVECVQDDIEIEADDLLKAWSEGERPEDLQMF